MKNNWKKLFTILLVVSLLMTSLVSCGGNDKDDTFLIGGIGPLTDLAASYGISVKQGAEIAVDEINEAGGVTVGDKKIKLELKFMDDQAMPDKAVTAYNALMDDGMDALLGTVTTDSAIGIGDITYADGMFTLTPSGSALEITKHPNTFRVCFTDPLQGLTMADFAKEEGYNKIAIMYNNSDNYSTGVMAAFVEQVEKNGGEIVANEAFSINDVDFNTQLTKIKATDAEVIFVPSYYDYAANIATQAHDLAMDLPFLGSDGWDGVIAQTVDPSILEGAIFLTPFLASSDDPATQAFVKEYEEKYNAIPDQFAADGYDGIYIIAAAMEEAQSTESADLIAAMTEIEVDGLTGFMTFTADGEPNKEANFAEIKNGEYIAR